MTESCEHQEIVAELVDAIGSRWPTATVCWDSRWAGWGARRVQVGQHIPDVTVSESASGRLLAIGEAKRWDDIGTEHTANQLREWLAKCDVPICLAMSRGYQESMEDAVETATGIEIGGRIYIYDGLFWWKRKIGTLGCWSREQ